MKPITLEWIAKAEGDFHSCDRENRARKRPNYDGACFHAQQCVEKYLKARLQEASIPFPKTHDLEELLRLVLPVEPRWLALKTAVAALGGFAIVFRYPGPSATRKIARETLKHSRFVRKIVRNGLGLRD